MDAQLGTRSWTQQNVEVWAISVTLALKLSSFVLFRILVGFFFFFFLVLFMVLCLFVYFFKKIF